jgi:hypothetical protein
LIKKHLAKRKFIGYGTTAKLKGKRLLIAFKVLSCYFTP